MNNPRDFPSSMFFCTVANRRRLQIHRQRQNMLVDPVAPLNRHARQHMKAVKKCSKHRAYMLKMSDTHNWSSVQWTVETQRSAVQEAGTHLHS